jgi:prolipoprotein diacylglyceryltransferase
MVHHIDPVIGGLFGIYLWWYGLSYALGFANAHLFLRGLGEALLRVQAVPLAAEQGELARPRT